MDNSGFLKRCELEMAQHTGLAKSQYDGVWSFTAIAGHVHNVDFDNATGKWTNGVFPGDNTGEFQLFADKTLELIGEDSWLLRIRIEQPREVLEFVEFYRQAKRVLKKPVLMQTVRMADVMGAIVLPFWIGSKIRILPMKSPRLLADLPQMLIEQIDWHLQDDDLNGLTCWQYMGEKWAKPLRPVTEPVEEDQFLWCTSPRLCVAKCEWSDLLKSCAWVCPPKIGISSMFWAEYFGYTKEGRAALDCVLRGGPVKDIAKRLRTTIITIPKDRLQQIRRAIEWRSGRIACHEAAASLIDKVDRSEQLAARYRKLLSGISRMDARKA